MRWTMSAHDRDEKLEKLIPSKERFECKIWAAIMPTGINAIPTSIASGLSLQYCYVGISNRKIYISIVDTFKVDKEIDRLIISFDNIERVKIKRGIFPNRKVVILFYKNRGKLKMSVMSNAIFTDIKDQKDNALIFFEILSQI